MKYHPKSIKNNLALTMGLFVMLTVMALGWVHYYAVRASIMDDVYKNELITDLKAHQSNLLIILEKAIETSATIADDPAFIQWFSGMDDSPETKQIALQKLDFLHKNLGYPSVFAVSNTTNEYWCEDFRLLDVVSEEDPDDSWFFETLRHTRKSTLNFDYNNVLKQSMLFVNVIMGDTHQPIGVAGVGIDPSILIKQFEQNKPSSNTLLWLIDSKGKILLSENTAEINTSLSGLFETYVVDSILNSLGEQIIREVHFSNEKYELATMPVGAADYKVVMIIPQSDLLEILDVIGYNTVWLTIIMLILTLIVASWLARNISRPIVHLTQLSSQLAHSKLDVTVKEKLVNRNDEIGQLAKEFASMQKQLSLVIKHLNTANADLEKEKSQLKSINIELNTAIEKASESEKLTKAFMANISHEVRTPMNSIMGFAQLLHAELIDNKELSPFANLIVENGHHLLAILNNIIEVAKMDSGVTKPSPGKFSVNHIIEDGIKLFSYGLKSNIQLINRTDSSHPETFIVSDELLVRRILNNLISNAIKYTQKGTIEVGFTKTAKEIVLFVSDTGIGIDKKDQESIFKPFWQASNSSSINEGAGLGLAISKKVVELLNGRIWLESEPGKGSVFYFSLPV
ncbi:HAMP domain-containing protein [Carboxylicivirga mesophila]|uniref:histidine kinase n=1 Tax=Carboxylicivirga mesophila TaxID=1166478 RepID=A0ABS5K9V7_9BACT|nr:hybrid sensor histidine kinase/response regulator [Carboxylicivirga mesophila]MBS2211790.1 HAMP domain-containing protein [Carboxylicivirga mesophila]